MKKIEVFLLKLLLSYRTIPNTGRLESPLALMGRQIRNETSEDEMMHNHVGQSEFENSDEDQIMQDVLDYSSVRDRSRSPRERNTRERQGEKSNPEN